MKTQLKFLVIAATVLTANSTLAQSAGAWIVRAGATTLAPQANSGNLGPPSLPNFKTDVGSDTQLGGGVTYMVTDNVSVDVPVPVPFTHTLYGAGAMTGVGQIGDVQALPITVFLQYRFLPPNATLRPYVGLGATYARFYNEQGSAALTALTNPGGPPTQWAIESKFALTPQMGVTLALDERWFVDVFYSKTYLRDKASLSTGQSVDITLDPNSYGIAIGYKF